MRGPDGRGDPGISVQTVYSALGRKAPVPQEVTRRAIAGPDDRSWADAGGRGGDQPMVSRNGPLDPAHQGAIPASSPPRMWPECRAGRTVGGIRSSPPVQALAAGVDDHVARRHSVGTRVTPFSAGGVAQEQVAGLLDEGSNRSPSVEIATTSPPASRCEHRREIELASAGPIPRITTGLAASSPPPGTPLSGASLLTGQSIDSATTDRP